jgi:hypothetical protein
MAWNEFWDCMGDDYSMLKEQFEEDVQETIKDLIALWKSLDPKVQAVLALLFGWYGKDAFTRLGKFLPRLAASPYFWAAVAGVGLGAFIALAEDCYPRFEEPAAEAS